MVSLALTLYVVPDATLTAAESLEDPETVNVPAVIVVAPVYVFTPANVS